MPPAIDAARPRIDYIDGLRAIAVLTVLGAHIALHAHLSGPLYHVAVEGAHGVDLFFVLSGFCLAYPTLQKWRSRGATEFRLDDFAAKRLVRIIPPFYIATFVLIVTAFVLRFGGHGATLNVPSPLDIAKSLLFLDERVQLINPSFWTLMVEFRWYFVFPVLLAIWLKSPRAFCAVGIASAVLYSLTRARGLDFGTLPGFMLGIIAADIQVGARLRRDIATIVQRVAFPLAILCGALGIAAEGSARIPGFDGNDFAWAYQPTIPGWQFAVFFFVVGIGALPRLHNLFSTRALVAVGVASYSIYLVHEPVVDVIVHRLGGTAGLGAAAVIALTVGFAFWYFAERPFTTGSLRAPLLDATRPIVQRCFGLLGLPGRVALSSDANDAVDARDGKDAAHQRARVDDRHVVRA